MRISDWSSDVCSSDLVMTARINYLELPVADTGAAKAFYGAAFGWSFTDFGPTYAATTSGDTDIGFQADATGKTAAALPVIEVDDLEAAEAAVWTAGGTITAPIFAFPGDRKSTRLNSSH